MSEPTLATAPEASSPFKFLDFFEEADHDLFAGRDREVNEVLAGILRARTLVLYGRSGLGKTSLLLAGVFPEIRKRGLTPVYMRPFDRPLDDLRTSLKETFPNLNISAESTLAGILRSASEKQGIVLVLDQLEELFIRFRERSEVRWDFIETIAGFAKDSNLEVRIIFSLREDYLAELDDFRTRLPELFANEYRLHPLTAFGARQAISRALQHAGLSYEQRLLTGLVDALEEYRYDPAILQILCAELYRETLRSGAPGALKLADLEQLGGIEGIFRRYLETLGKALQPEQRLLAMVVLDSLVTQEHTKKAVTIESLVHGYFVTSPGEMSETVDLLVAHRLVRRVERGKEIRFELIHDRLVDPVQGWLTLDPQFFALRSANDLVIHAALNGRFRQEPELLLTAGQLRFVVGEFRDRLRFTKDQLELLFRSAVYRHAPVTDWAALLGGEQCKVILYEMLASEGTEIRKGATEAVGSLPSLEADGPLADSCLELALYDESHEVRRVAVQSLARLGYSSRLRHFVEILRLSAARSVALETLADIAQAGDLPSNVPIAWRFWVQRIVQSRRIEQYRDTVRNRGVAGALYGGLATLAYNWWWSILPAIFGESKMILFGLISVAAGVLLGWTAGSCSAKVGAIRGMNSWFESIWRSAAHLSIIAACLLVFALSEGEWRPSWLAIPLLVHLLSALQVSWAQRCIGPETSKLRCWGWIVLHTISSPLLILLLVGYVIASTETPWGPISEELAIVVFGSIPLLYLSISASIPALVFCERRVPFPREVPRPRIRAWAQVLIAGTFVLSIIGIIVMVRSAQPFF